MYSVQNVQKITTVTPELGKRHKRATNVTSLKWQQRNQDVMDCNYRLQMKFAKVMLLQVSVCLGGACLVVVEGGAWQGGVRGRRVACTAGGCVWQVACMAEGCAWQGGHAWAGGHMWWGMYVWQGGMHGREHTWQRAPLPPADTTRYGQ